MNNVDDCFLPIIIYWFFIVIIISILTHTRRVSRSIANRFEKYILCAFRGDCIVNIADIEINFVHFATCHLWLVHFEEVIFLTFV